MPQFELHAMPEDLLPELPLPDISINIDMQYDLLEAALRMEVTARCQRAYVHDLNNSLQPVLAGVETLIRAATVGTLAPVEQIVDFARLAVSQHRAAMTGLIDTLIGPDAPPADVDLNDTLQKLVAFVTHDAGQHQVKLSLRTGEALRVHAQASKLRLMVLALLIDAIDALAACGGSVDVDVVQEQGSVTVAVADSRLRPESLLLSRQPDSLRSVLLLPALRRMAARQGGCIEIPVAAGRHSVHIRLPLAG